MRWSHIVLAVFALLGLAVLSGLAHVRLKNPSNGAVLFWSAPANVSIVISSAGSDDITDGSHETALRSAIQAWNDVPGSLATLVENTSPAQQARTDWAADNIHLVLFDESNTSGYFPGGSGTVAITPVWFNGGGVITDADVLFNGSNFQFTTSQKPGRFDVHDVGIHEIGHLLGLDHSGWAGATMYPYVNTSVILHRSLSQDDEHGARDMYPDAVHASITGTVKRQADSSLVAGAHVIARDANGRAVAGILSSSNGVFTLSGLLAGTYTLYATPFEGPVSSANLGPGHVIQTDFSSTIHGTVVVNAGAAVNMGDLLVDADAGFVLGKNTDAYPFRATSGTTTSHLVRGANIVAGTLTVSDPSLVLSGVLVAGGVVQFNLTVPAGASPGHVDLMLENGAERSILPAALEVTPPDPGVVLVSPAMGDQAGGTAVTISGSAFRPGLRVVIGENIYVDGLPGGCTVVDPNTITLVTQPTQGGEYDVVVIDATGVEGRLVDGFETTAIPAVSTIFPTAGAAAGGTRVVLTGEDFVAGLLITIDGVPQSNVVVDSSTKVTIITDPGAPGGPYLVEVQNPGGGVATTAFAYAASPDPSIAGIDPPEGSVAGGDTVTITGSGFTPSSTVSFGIDPDSGQGGAPATEVTFIDSSTLEVLTPTHQSGPHSVLVLETSNGQANVVPAGFTYLGSGGGGGGGCHAGTRIPRGPGKILEGGAWFAAAFLVLLLNTRRAGMRLRRARQTA